MGVFVNQMSTSPRDWGRINILIILLFKIITFHSVKKINFVKSGIGNTHN